MNRQAAAALSAQARALLDRRAAKSQIAVSPPTIPRLAPDASAPLSFAQWRLWFLEQLRPGTHAWNTPIVTRLHGPLDRAALAGALQLLVDRHPTLRTVFPAPRSRPVCVPHPDPRIALTLAELPARQSPDDWVAREIRRPFDLEHDLMLRAALLKLDDTDHVLALVAHHIACDGWSKGLLVGELNAAYEALVRGEQPALPELAVRYSDFAAWQREWLTGLRLQRLQDYWRERLNGHPVATALPTDLPRPRVQGFTGAVHWLHVPGALAAAAVALGRRNRATPFMTLVAAFKALLYAYSGQDDLLLGSPAAMRTLPELEPIVGLFANTLVYRTSMAGDPTFAQLIARVRDTAIGVYQHQDLPFDRIVEAVSPPRDPSRNPLVQVNMRVEGREPEVRLPGLRSRPMAVDPGIARFDLAIELAQTDDGYAGYLEYNTSLFTAETAGELAQRYVQVLDAVVAAPDTALTELGIVRDIRASASAR